jgi:hypothetical protein
VTKCKEGSVIEGNMRERGEEIEAVIGIEVNYKECSETMIEMRGDES